MDLNLYRNKRGFIELDKLKPEKLEDGNIFIFLDLMLLKFLDGDEIFFKNNYEENSYKLYSNLLISEIAKQIGLKHAKYDIGVYDGHQGVITWSFLKKDEVFIRGSEIICSVNKEYGTDYKNNLTDISKALKLYINDEKTEKELMEQLTVNYYMFDIAVAEEDRHSNNWGIIFNPNELTYRCADIFDTDSLASTFWGERCISAHLDDIKLYDETIDFKKLRNYSKDSQPRLLYDPRCFPVSYDFDFFCKNNIELAKKGFDIIGKIDIKSAFENVEAKIGIKLPEEYKKWLEIMVNYRINLMKETIYKAEMLKFATEEGNAPRI